MRKATVVIAAVAITAALSAPLALAADSGKPTDVTDLNLQISSAKLVVQTLAPKGVEVSGSDPVLQGKPVAVNGTIARNGTLAVAPTGFLFPELPIPEDKLKVKGVSVDILLMKQAAGTVNNTTGEIRMPLNLAISLKAPELGLKCLIRGFDLTFITGKVSVGSGADAVQLPGSIWNKSTGALTIVGAGLIPDAAKIPASDCDVVSRLVASNLSGKALGLSIAGVARPGSTYRAPAAATITANSLAFSNKRATVRVSCSGTAATRRSCSGDLSLTVNTATPFTLTTRYSAAAGQSANVAFSLTDAQRTAIRANRVNGAGKPPGGKLVLSVDNGTGTSRTLSSVSSN